MQEFLWKNGARTFVLESGPEVLCQKLGKNLPGKNCALIKNCERTYVVKAVQEHTSVVKYKKIKYRYR